MAHHVPVTYPLGTAARARRQLALMLLPLASVLIVAGVLALSAGAGVALMLLGGLAAAVGVLLGLIAAGLRRQALAAEDRQRELDLDAVLLAADPGCGESCDACIGQDCAVKSLPRL